MKNRSVPGLWRRWGAGLCIASSVALLGCAACAGPSMQSSRAANLSPASGRASGSPLTVLQLNLCDSGIASCYTGRSVAAAVQVIDRQRPTIVTLNEVCRNDMPVVARAMSGTLAGARVTSAFRAAGDRPTNGPFRCVNGQPYGIGIVAVIPSAISRYRTYSGIFPRQDLADPEERVWLCLDMAGALLACTTHTASTSTTVALAQCRYLLQSVLPTIGREPSDALVLGADLNLRSGDSPGPQSCLPPGYERVDDGSRQDIITSAGFAVRSRLLIDMRGTTDHPGLLVKLRVPSREPDPRVGPHT